MRTTQPFNMASLCSKAAEPQDQDPRDSWDRDTILPNLSQRIGLIGPWRAGIGPLKSKWWEPDLDPFRSKNRLRSISPFIQYARNEAQKHNGHHFENCILVYKLIAKYCNVCDEYSKRWTSLMSLSLLLSNELLKVAYLQFRRPVKKGLSWTTE